MTIVENNTLPDSSNHSLYLMKMFVFSRPKGNKLVDHNKRSERQYRHELPPAFALLKPSFTIFQVPTQTTFKVSKHIYKDIDIDIYIFINIYIYVDKDL